MSVGDISALIDSLNDGRDVTSVVCRARSDYGVTACVAATTLYIRSFSLDSAGNMGTLYTNELSVETNSAYAIGGIIQVAEGIVAVLYQCDETDLWKLKCATFSVSAVGVVAAIDTITLYDEMYSAPHDPPLSSALPRTDIVQVSTGIYACVAQIDTSSSGIFTWAVATDGTMGTDRISLKQVTKSGNFTAGMWQVSGTTWAMITCSAEGGIDLTTFTLSSAGSLGSTLDSWNIGAGNIGIGAGIAWYGTVQLISYTTSTLNTLATVSISAAGVITKTLIDTDTNGGAKKIFKLSNSVALLEYYFPVGSESISSRTVSTDGDIGAEVDSVGTGDWQYLMDAGEGIYLTFKRSFDIPSLGMVLRSYSVTEGAIGVITTPQSRVSGLVHRYFPGHYSLEVFIGGTSSVFLGPKVVGTVKPAQKYIPIEQLPPEDPFAGNKITSTSLPSVDIIPIEALPPEDPYAVAKSTSKPSTVRILPTSPGIVVPRDVQLPMPPTGEPSIISKISTFTFFQLPSNIARTVVGWMGRILGKKEGEW